MSAWSTNSMRLRLQGLRDRERAAGARGLRLGAEHIMQVAKSRVPIEEATLERSGAVSVDEAAQVAAMSFDTPYAPIQHERLDFKHDAGRQAKFLESAMTGERDVVTRLIADEIRNDLNG